MFFFFFCHGPPSTVIYTLSLHDALPIYKVRVLIMQLFGWFEFGISLGLNQPILFLCVHYYSNQCTSQFLALTLHMSLTFPHNTFLVCESYRSSPLMRYLYMLLF